MNTSTFQTYKAARSLRDEADRMYGRLILLADHGVSKAEDLLSLAYERYSRRAKQVEQAASHHWGSL